MVDADLNSANAEYKAMVDADLNLANAEHKVTVDADLNSANAEHKAMVDAEYYKFGECRTTLHFWLLPNIVQVTNAKQNYAVGGWQKFCRWLIPNKSAPLAVAEHCPSGCSGQHCPTG